MAASDAPLDRMRAALEELARADAGELVAEARAEARARVRSMLADRLADAMLEGAAASLSDQRAASAPKRSEAPQAPSSERTAVYVYGVLARDAATATDDVRGLWGQEVEAVCEGEVAAVLSRVPAAEFEEAALRTHLADMAWVESVARSHQEVLDHLCRRMTVIPMRMCTVYQAESGVREMLEREVEALKDALEHLDGKRELGVQAFFSRSRAAPAATEEEHADRRDQASSGAAYLARKREERELEARLDELVEGAVQEIHEQLAEIAADSALSAVQSREASGNRGDMVLNGAYLVADEDRDAFSERVDVLGSRFQAVGLELAITGPWPPYNFLPGSIGATW
jgi:hypothetical protein